MSKLKFFLYKSVVLLTAASLLFLISCGSSAKAEPEDSTPKYNLTGSVKGKRDNTSVCLIPEYPGEVIYSNELASIDASNASDGYICVKYTGDTDKVKLQISCPNTTTYTYNLGKEYEVFPLTSDSGQYRIAVYENIENTKYSTAFTQDIDVEITNEFGAYLYPNQYVNFTSEDSSVHMAAKLAYPADDDLSVVTYIYNYVISNITYDTQLAETVQSGYLPDNDRTLATGKGICLDYASLMASMLRSQNIPTHMEIGYAGSAYHAWISVYLREVGWVNGIIEFDGTDWSLMDPTFASGSSDKELKEFIGDGANYETKYIY